jgi:predicted porin
LSLGSIEYLDMQGYNGSWQYSAYARYLFAKDADSAFGLYYRNLFGLSVYTSELTHRLARFPSSDPALVGTPAAGGADFLDLSPNQNFAIDRVVNNFNFRTTPFINQYLRFVANSWQQSKSGTEQVLFRAREAKAGVINNGQKGGVGLPVDSDTTENTIGADIPIGRSSVVNYRFSDTKFSGGDTGITSGSRLDFLPLNALTRVDSDTKSSIIKVRSSIGHRLFFTGVQTNRERDNTRADLSHPTSARINSTNAAITYLATDSLTLTGRYRHFDQDNQTGPVISGGEPTNMALSDAVQSTSLEATYAGIPRAFFKLGYERRDVDRSTTNGDPGFPIIELSSKSNIITGGFRYYPNMRLSLSANGTLANADNAGYAGVANDQKKINANATYMIRDEIALYADYSLLDERNDQIRVPFADIPPAATNAAQEELREEAAGQGYKNKMATSTIGTWYALTPKLVFDANYARIQTDAATTWIIGIDPTALPHIAPDYVPYEANNNQWSAGLTYSLSPRWRVYGRYMLSKSNGRSVIDPAKFPGSIGPTWTPVNVREQRYTLGFACDVSIKDSLSMDYSFSDWTDFIDSANDGIFDIWRVAWSHQF